MKQKEIKYIINKNGCFECISHFKTSDGHCQIQRNGKRTYIHKLIYNKTFGNTGNNLIIRHKCDNPSCINPDHLESGTHKDNVLDRVKRKRSAFGQKHGRAKLTDKNVKFIRNNKELSNFQLAALFKVDSKVIRNVKQFKSWKHIL